MNREEYFKYYIQGSDHYLIPKDVFDALFNEMSNWREETKELKKQLEKKYSKIGTLTNEVLYEENTKLINQQKEFIEYLEDNEKNLDIKANGMCASSERDELIIKARAYREILSKYKEIIGGKDER